MLTMVGTVEPMSESSYAVAAKIVKEGGLIVYPTDTVYGLGCDPFNEGAVARLFEAKGRGSKPVPVLCSSSSMASQLVELSPKAAELASKHWPGALTIVAPLKRKVPSQLVQGGPDLGVRVPGEPRCLRLLEVCGGWMTGTSANLTGMASARTADEAAKQLGGSVDMILDGGALAGRESTVVQVVGDKVAILRTGQIGVADG